MNRSLDPSFAPFPYFSTNLVFRDFKNCRLRNVQSPQQAMKSSNNSCHPTHSLKTQASCVSSVLLPLQTSGHSFMSPWIVATGRHGTRNNSYQLGPSVNKSKKDLSYAKKFCATRERSKKYKLHLPQWLQPVQFHHYHPDQQSRRSPPDSVAVLHLPQIRSTPKIGLTAPAKKEKITQT